MQRDYVPLFRSICTSEKFAALKSDAERLMYVLLLTQCDSWGRCEDSPITLNALCWPLLGRKPRDVEAALDSLDQSGLLRRFSHGSRRWIQITGWEARAGRVGHPDRRGASQWPANGVAGVVRSTPDQSGVVHSEQSRAEQSRGEEEEPAPVATAPAAAAPAKKPRAVANTPHQQTIDRWCTAYLDSQGERYAVQGKDTAAVKAMLKQHTPDEILAQADKLLFCESPFHAEHRTLAWLASRWNEVGQLARAHSLRIEGQGSKVVREAARAEAAGARPLALDFLAGYDDCPKRLNGGAA